MKAAVHESDSTNSHSAGADVAAEALFFKGGRHFLVKSGAKNKRSTFLEQKLEQVEFLQLQRKLSVVSPSHKSNRPDLKLSGGGTRLFRVPTQVAGFEEGATDLRIPDVQLRPNHQF